MNIPLFKKLHEEGLLSDSSLEIIKSRAGTQLVSIYPEIKTILYLGILLMTGGLGVLVYKNIDSIGHQVVLVFIGVVCTGSFFYCFKNKLPFTTDQVKAPNSFFDYILLLACLTFIIFIAYFQYQYNVFGKRYGLATFVPMVVLFFAAYYFDHLGVLSLAITNLATWLGITVTPLEILKSNDFNSTIIILTGFLFGISLIVAGLATVQTRVKPHFEFTYTNFGLHILFISVIAGMFHFYAFYFFIFLLLAALTFYFYRRSKNENSFYMLLVSTLYFYIGLSDVVLHLLDHVEGVGIGIFYMAFIYFIASGIGLIRFLMYNNKTFKHDRV